MKRRTPSHHFTIWLVIERNILPTKRQWCEISAQECWHELVAEYPDEWVAFQALERLEMLPSEDELEDKMTATGMRDIIAGRVTKEQTDGRVVPHT